MLPLLSVIIPVFNTERYISECIKSVISQNLEKTEIICVDDGSSDGSVERLFEYAKQDSRISVITQKNSGVASARNHALSFACGKYLFFLDSDDFIMPGGLEALYNKAETENADIVISKQKIFSDKNREEYVIRGFEQQLLPHGGSTSFTAKDISDMLFQTFSSELHGKLFKRRLIKQNHITFPSSSIGEDFYFFYLALMLANKIAVLDKVTYNYRRLRDGSLTMASNNTLDFFESLTALLSRMNENNISEIYQSSYEDYVIKQAYLNASRSTSSTRKQIFIRLNKDYPNLFQKENVSGYTPLKELKQLYEELSVSTE